MRLSGLAPRRLQAHADLPFTQLWFKFCKGAGGTEDDDQSLRTLVDSAGEYERRAESVGSLTISLRLSIFSLATLQRAGARRDGCNKKLFSSVQHIMASCVTRLRELGATCEAMDRSALATVAGEALGALGIFVEVLTAVVAAGPLPEGRDAAAEAGCWADLMPGVLSLAAAYFEAILLALGSSGPVGSGSSSSSSSGSGSGGSDGSGGELDAHLAKHRTALWRLLSATLVSHGAQSQSHSNGQLGRLAELCSLLLRRLDMKQIQRLGLEALRARPSPGGSADSGAGITRLFELFCLSSLQQCLDGAPGSARAASLSSLGASSQEWCSHVARVMSECHTLITALQTVPAPTSASASATASAMAVDGDGDRQHVQSTRNALLRLLTAAVHGGVPYSKTILPQLAKLKRLAAEIRGALKTALQQASAASSDSAAVLASVALDLEAVQLLVGMDHQLVAYTSGEAQDGTDDDAELLPRQREFRLLFGHSAPASARVSDALQLCSAQQRLLGTLVGVHTELRRVEEMVRDLAAMSSLPALSRLLSSPVVQSQLFDMMKVPSNQLEALWACLPVDSLAELGGQRALLGVLVGNVLHATRRDSPWRPFAALSPALERLSLELEQGQGQGQGPQSDALVGLAHLLRLASWALSREGVDVYTQPFVGRLYARLLGEDGSAGEGERSDIGDAVGAGGAAVLPLQLSMAALLLNAAGRCYAAPVPELYSVQEVRRRLSLAVGRACALGSAELAAPPGGSGKGKKRKSSGQGAQASEEAGASAGAGAGAGLEPLVLPLLQSFSVWGEMAELCPPDALGRAIFQALRAAPSDASSASASAVAPRTHGRLRLELSRTALQDSALLQAALSGQVSSTLLDTLQSLRAAVWTRALLAAALKQLELLDSVPRRLWFAANNGGDRAALQAQLLPGLAEVLLRAGQGAGEQGLQCVQLVLALSAVLLDLLRGGDLVALAAMLSAESMQGLARLGVSPEYTSAALLGWFGALLRASAGPVVLAVLEALAEAGLGSGPVCSRSLRALLRDTSGSRAQSAVPLQPPSPAAAGLVRLCTLLSHLARGTGPLGLAVAPEALWALAKVPTEHSPEAAALLDNYSVPRVELGGVAVARRWVQLVGTLLHIYYARGRGLTRGEREIVLGRLSEALGWYCAAEPTEEEAEEETEEGRPEVSMAIVGLLLTAPDPPARSQVLDALRSCSLQPGAAWLSAQAGRSILEAVVAAGASRSRGQEGLAAPLAESARLVAQAASRASVYEGDFAALCGALADTLQYGLGVLRMQGPGGARGGRGGGGNSGSGGGGGGGEGSEAMWAALCVDVTATLAARMTARVFPASTQARLSACTRGLLLVLEQLVASRSALLRTSLGAFAACLAQLVHWVVQAHRPALGASKDGSATTSSGGSSSDLLDAIKRVFNAVAVSKELQQCCGLLATSTLQLLAACGGAEHSALEALLQGVSVLLARCTKRQRLQVHDLLGADARILYADLSRELGVGRIVL